MKFIDNFTHYKSKQPDSQTLKFILQQKPNCIIHKYSGDLYVNNAHNFFIALRGNPINMLIRTPL